MPLLTTALLTGAARWPTLTLTLPLPTPTPTLTPTPNKALLGGLLFTCTARDEEEDANAFATTFPQVSRLVS